MYDFLDQKSMYDLGAEATAIAQHKKNKIKKINHYTSQNVIIAKLLAVAISFLRIAIFPVSGGVFCLSVYFHLVVVGVALLHHQL